MEKVVVFIDYEGLLEILEKEKLQIDLLAIRDYLAEGRILTDMFCYPGVMAAREDGFLDSLMANGVLVPFRPGRRDASFRGNTEICLVLDVVDYVSLLKPDIVVIVTGDRNYAPLADWLRSRGIRIEVALTENGVSPDLRKSANGFINLSMVVEEVQNTEGGNIPQRLEVREDAGSNN